MFRRKQGINLKLLYAKDSQRCVAESEEKISSGAGDVNEELDKEKKEYKDEAVQNELEDSEFDSKESPALVIVP